MTDKEKERVKRLKEAHALVADGMGVVRACSTAHTAVSSYKKWLAQNAKAAVAPTLAIPIAKPKTDVDHLDEAALVILASPLAVRLKLKTIRALYAAVY